jgi:NAD(P)-dependent dehydrogenase (short-subunit alcohol dehydrogenase family)
MGKFGRIDVLVNNAGYGHLGPFEEASAAEIEAQYRVNVYGAMHVTRAVLPVMRQQQSGRIFNISSVAGLTGAAMASLYCSSKFALEGWSESLAAELSPLGIHVTAVEPGFFRTDFLDSSSIRYTPATHAEYRSGHEQMQTWLNGKNHLQEGDPVKFAEVLLHVAEKETQPTHLVLGSDAIGYLRARIERDTLQLEEWSSVSASTDF